MVDELERARLGPIEDTLALAEHHRERHQNKAVDQSGREQRRIDRAAPLDQQIAALALLELGNRIRNVATEPLAVSQVSGSFE